MNGGLFNTVSDSEVKYDGRLPRGETDQMEIMRKKTSRSKTSTSAAKLTGEIIEEQTNAFLKAGGKIRKIRSGVKDQEVPVENAKVTEKA